VVCGRFDTTFAALQESEARHAADLAALREEAKASFQPVWDRLDNLSRDLGGQQEDIAATRATVGALCARVDAFVERLDRQAGAVRALHAAGSQRDTELEQLVEGLARLRACPMPELAGEL
jgi:septal ring factor EnvC (AmiA/AmiB activator)